MIINNIIIQLERIDGGMVQVLVGLSVGSGQVGIGNGTRTSGYCCCPNCYTTDSARAFTLKAPSLKALLVLLL